VHSLGIIHRDIKPGNILLVQIRPGEPLRPKLTDFGIARIADSARLTATGTMVGTAAYLSPEQAMGSPLSPATDIYSLGLVLLECIKQNVEYPGNAVESAVARIHRSPEIPADMPAEWAGLIRSMTAIEPLERPTAADVETALRQALVSPVSIPGELTSETTRVLPAMPFRPPSITAETELPGNRAIKGEVGLPGGSTASRAHLFSRLRLSGMGLWSAVVLGLLAVVAIAIALTLNPAPESPPDVVPYPTVTGSLGDHLKELQESVEP
jgi:serine/threonine protein kinase